MLDRTKSAALFEEAKTLFPGGVNSPVRAFKSVTGPPLFLKRGKGARIWDEDDNELIDFCGSWGPLILGHAPESVIEQIIETVKKGTSFGTPELLGNELGKIIIENNRFVEKIRFVSSGTEAVMSAIRLARGYTGKSKILKFEGCYHGHVDSLLVKAGSGLVTFGETTSAGIPESFIKETLVIGLADPHALEEAFAQFGHELACVIIEPVPANNGLLLQDKEYLQLLRDLCSSHGVLLIFDEVISGFRLGFEGAAGYYDIKPDILTYGKIIGGGMPVGAYGASNELMKMIAPDGPVYQAGTLSANPVAMAAGLATCKELLKPDFYEELSRKTERFVEAIQSHCNANSYPIRIQYIGSIFWISFVKQRISSADQIDVETMKYFKKLHFELLNRHIYLGPSGYEVGFISSAHTEEILEVALQKICEAIDTLYTEEL